MTFEPKENLWLEPKNAAQLVKYDVVRWTYYGMYRQGMVVEYTVNEDGYPCVLFTDFNEASTVERLRDEQLAGHVVDKMLVRLDQLVLAGSIGTLEEIR